jgi:uroporphyrinogen decarboxylase
VWNGLAEHFRVAGVNEVRRRLGVDIVLISPQFEDRAFAARTSIRVPGDSTIGGRLAVANPDGTYTDQWGVRYGLDAKQTVERIVCAPFPDAAMPCDYRWPSLEDMESVGALRSRIAALHEEGFCVFGSALNPFKQAWQLRGFEEFLMDLHLNPDFSRALLGRLEPYAVEMARRLVRAGADVVALVGDVAMQDRMLFKTDLFAEFLTPVFRNVIDSARRIRPVPFMFHSDGNIMPILPELIRAGFSIVNPIQPESMDPAEVKRRYGDRLTLHGTISVQTTLPHGTEQDVRAAVRKMIDACGCDGGLILSTTNDAMPDIPLRNLLALYDEAIAYSSRAVRGRKKEPQA